MPLKHRTVILAKNEVTYNTDAAPTGTDAVLAENVQWSWDSARLYKRLPTRPSMTGLKSLYGGSLVQVQFEVEVKGSGAAGTAPEVGALLQACGLRETVNASTSVVYTPLNTPASHKSNTIWVYEDGLCIKLTGCRGNVSLNAAVGNAARMTFTMTGHFASRTDISLITPTYDSTVPPISIGMASLAFDSFAAKVTKFDALAKPGNLIQSDGFGEIRITQREVMGSFDPEQELVAAYNWISKWQSSGAYAFASGTVGGSAGNRWGLVMPAITYTEIGNGDRDGILTHDVKFEARESSGSDEFTLTYT
jgi:hypothetical protein